MPNSPQGFIARTNRLAGELAEQGRRVQGMVEAAFEALFDASPERARWVLDQDDVIDATDVELERASVLLLMDATRQGAELDSSALRAVLTIVKINNELERVADVACDVAELVKPAAGQIAPHRFPDTFRVMANSVIGILRDVNASVARNDAQLAHIVLQSRHAVTAFKNALLRDAEESIARGIMTVDFAFLLHEVASQCEVIVDHATNMAEQVIYLNTGAIVRHGGTAWVRVPEQG